MAEFRVGDRVRIEGVVVHDPDPVPGHARVAYPQLDGVLDFIVPMMAMSVIGRVWEIGDVCVVEGRQVGRIEGLAYDRAWVSFAGGDVFKTVRVEDLELPK